jgi:hypothetical protein
MAVSFSALLVATLVMLALYRIDAAIAVALAWCLPMAHPSTVPNELGRYRDSVAVIDAPCPRNNRSARRTTYWRAELHLWQARWSDVAGGSCAQLFRPAPQGRSWREWRPQAILTRSGRPWEPYLEGISAQ